MNFHKIFKGKEVFSKRKKQAASLFRVLPSFALMAIMMPLITCGMTAIDISEKEGKTPQVISGKDRREALPEERDFRGWIHSVSLFPPLVNKESTLRASANWGPTGMTGITLRYEWFVNGKKVVSENSGRLSLSSLRSGDRIYAVALLLLREEKIIASHRSRSTVIQNRPPRLEAGLKEMREEGDDLVGFIVVSDPDGDFFTMRLLDGPSGLSLASDGRVRWPLSEVTSGEHHMTIEMEDERGLGLLETLLFSMDRGREG